MEFKGLKYCTRCIMPETVEGQKFDKDGVCITCQAQEAKKEVNWGHKKDELAKIIKKAKSKAGNNYDCIIPISGGKDSIYQIHVMIKEFGVKPLCVTFNHNWFTSTGWYNLQNCLETFELDHVMFTPNRRLVNKIARRSVEIIGDACWHCHAGVAAFTIQMAVFYKVPLIIWGESAAEYGHQGNTYKNHITFDRDYFTKLSSKFSCEEFACEYLTLRDLYPFKLPEIEECKDLKGIHLGNYIPWDAEKNTKLMKNLYRWKGRDVGGAYKDYKSVECSMAGIHDFLCYLKRGFGRASIQASGDIRDYGMSREEAFRLVEKYERIEPIQLEYFLQITGLSAIDFREYMEKLKHESIKGINLPADKEWRALVEEGKPFMVKMIEAQQIGHKI